jgi:hypothetical protein
MLGAFVKPLVVMSSIIPTELLWIAPGSSCSWPHFWPGRPN